MRESENDESDGFREFWCLLVAILSESRDVFVLLSLTVVEWGVNSLSNYDILQSFYTRIKRLVYLLKCEEIVSKRGSRPATNYGNYASTTKRAGSLS